MAKPTKQQLTEVAEHERYDRMDRQRVEERYNALVLAHNTLQGVINRDREFGHVDEDAAQIMRKLCYQIIKTIHDHNVIWSVEDGGTSYPDNNATDNDWVFWDVRMTAPVHRFYPTEDDENVSF